MLARVVLCSLFLACAFTPANALTQEELLARLEAAGYSQIRENGSGKINSMPASREVAPLPGDRSARAGSLPAFSCTWRRGSRRSSTRPPR
jgi:hypothetical protein